MNWATSPGAALLAERLPACCSPKTSNRSSLHGALFSLPCTRPACPVGSDQISLSHILCLSLSLLCFLANKCDVFPTASFWPVTFNPVWTGQALLMAQPSFLHWEPVQPGMQRLLLWAEVQGTWCGAPQRWWAGAKGLYKENLHFTLLLNFI